MDPVLSESVEPVLRDLARTQVDAPRFDDHDWIGDREYVSCMMWSADGSGSGLSVRRAASREERVAHAADQVQEWAIENRLWTSAPTNWPPCPIHPASHPLRASVAASNAAWVCPIDHSVVALIGEIREDLFGIG
ncbi:hypothetical protein [Nocardioides sp. zg-1228]|uniref:hypothetical protein n=1 Tax=Nocardioides sp. zg-1228 TaxID=2763008 RepID=UPI0016430F01|nr:hypothetical protein [Nocardioides sp. zg-1228]MBC2934041.1 hypothetical protein [Nocardioides sp. zg-1228]QSF58796.1 hypothetical protein JX575_06330 [Nocardioides sp. zg-1228]